VLTLSDQGMLVCFALNTLWAQAQDEDCPGCCPNCCAPCYLLRELDEGGLLDDVVRQAPPELWQGVSWWRNNQVDRNWLHASQQCMARPRCADA
jgi:hypothetical protein